MRVARALAQVAERARASGAEARVAAVLARSGTATARAGLEATLFRHARVALQFHPDRLLASGESVAEGLLASGVYKSQFETRISNGSRSAFPGGERDRWEDELFGGAYRGSDPAERPRYGALHALGHADGPAPRFGSCYLLLRREVAGRTTFSWGDSHLGPEHVATRAHFAPVLASWLEALEAGAGPLGRACAVGELEGMIERAARSAPEEAPFGRTLDDYVEAQVHGGVELARDAERLVIDPCFDGTETGTTLAALAARYGLELARHRGFELEVARVPDDFRGPRMPSLALRVAAGFARDAALFDAAAIGRAAADHARAPERWRDWASPDETLQHLKQLWHVLVQFGHTRGARG